MNSRKHVARRIRGKQIRHAYKVSQWLDKHIEAYGAEMVGYGHGVTGDFVAAWKIRHQAMLGKALKQTTDPLAREILLEALERYMP